MIDEELVAFDGDWLTVDFFEHFDVRFRISPWNAGLTVQYWQDGNWANASHDPNIPLFRPLDYPENHPVRCFLNGIPSEVIDLTEPYELNRLTLMRFVREEPAVRDLLAHSPGILFLFLDWFQANDVTIEEACAIIKKRRREILTFATGRAVSESTVRFLKKFQPSGYGQEELDILCRAISNEALITRFRHIKSFDKTALQVALNNSAMLSCRFFEDALKIHGDASHAVRVWNDTERMGRALGIQDHGVVIKNCRTVEQLTAIHDRWMDRLNEEAVENGEPRATIPPFTGDFPDPPIPGDGNIEPILTASDLHAEGRAMRHCVRSYAEDVANGRSFIYRVKKPERGTLELRITGDKIRMGQLKLIRNRPASFETRKSVQDWLKSRMTSTSPKMAPRDSKQAVDLLPKMAMRDAKRAVAPLPKMVPPHAKQAVDALKTVGYQFSQASRDGLLAELEALLRNGSINTTGTAVTPPGMPGKAWIIFPDDSALVVQPESMLWRPPPLPPEVMWSRIHGGH